MASFAVEEFVGNGCLKVLLPKLLEGGWDDVPTLKIMNAEDMNEMNMTPQQKVALEIRSYLHDRALMQYADSLETSGKSLPELLSLNTADLSSHFRMKRGHIARFSDRTSPCGTDTLPALYSLQARRRTATRVDSISKSEISSLSSKKMQTRTRSTVSSSDGSLEKSMVDLRLKEGHVFKGIVAATPKEPRACGCVQAPPVAQKIGPYSAIENISVQRLTPEYKIGMDSLVKTQTPPMKASEVWRDKPAVLLCMRRPGCIMCRAEAYQLYSKKPIFDALGIKLVAVLHEFIESEVRDFWPRYWGGAVVHDRGMEFFKALGGGKLQKEKFIPGFVFNLRAIANYKRAKAMGVKQNFRGEGEIKGGLFIVGKGKTGIAYQVAERNFGDWAPLAEVTEICCRLQNIQLKNQSQSMKSIQDSE